MTQGLPDDTEDDSKVGDIAFECFCFSAQRIELVDG